MSPRSIVRAMQVVAVPAREAEELRRELHRLRIVDRSLRISKRGGDVLIPVKAIPSVDLVRFHARLELTDSVTARPVARNPSEDYRRRAHRYGVPAGLAPARWKRVGDVAVVRLSEEAREHGPAIGAALAETLDVQAVVEDMSGIHGILRTPEVRILWGRGLEVVHQEGGVRYMLDVAKIMFASGNLPERISVAAKIPDGAVVVDLFAGIGYFTLPIAVHAHAARIYACELNPVAYHYLIENLRLNRAANVVPLPGDCRETAPRGIADVVLMGHFSAHEYLDVAFDALRGTGLVLYHELCPREQFPQALIERFTAAAREHWYDVDAVQSRIVKSYAPGIVHAALEARVTRRPRGPRPR